jgi:hypothetical protein
VPPRPAAHVPEDSGSEDLHRRHVEAEHHQNDHHA